MQDNLITNDELMEKLAEKTICLEKKLFSKMINNLKSLEEDKFDEIKIINNNITPEKNRYNETKVEKLNRKLKEGRSLL